MVGVSREVVAIARQRVVGRKAPGWLKVEIKDLVGGKGAVVDADVVKLACEERIIPAFCIRRGARTRFASDDERVVVPIGDASGNGGVVHGHAVNVEKLLARVAGVGAHEVMPAGNQPRYGMSALLVASPDVEYEPDGVLMAADVVAATLGLGKQAGGGAVAEGLPVAAVGPEADRDCGGRGERGVVGDTEVIPGGGAGGRELIGPV